MRLGSMVMTYFLIGALVLAGGVVPPAETGLVQQFIDTGDHSVNEDQVSAEGGGFLSNLVTPVENALNTVAGGGLIAVLNKIDAFLGYIAWPYTLLNYWNAPWQLTYLIAGPLSVGFTIGGLRVLRSSV